METEQQKHERLRKIAAHVVATSPAGGGDNYFIGWPDDEGRLLCRYIDELRGVEPLPVGRVPFGSDG